MVCNRPLSVYLNLQETKPDETAPVVKPRTDVKEMKSTIMKLTDKIKELENGITALQSDKNEVKCSVLSHNPLCNFLNY